MGGEGKRGLGTVYSDELAGCRVWELVRRRATREKPRQIAVNRRHEITTHSIREVTFLVEKCTRRS